MRANVAWGLIAVALGAMGCAASAKQTDSGSGGAAAAGGSGGFSAVGGSGGVGAVGGSGGFAAIGGSGGFAAIGGSGGTGGFCTGRQCQQMPCTVGSTTISGTVYDPAGKNPLYNVAAYVPNEVVQALPQGATCDSCESLYTGHPIAVGLTDATGHFTIQNAPVGENIPLVIQVGKWRRQFVVPSVAACQDTAVPDHTLTLPKNRSEGDIPNIAIATGGADTLECLLRRIGVDASEYTPGAGGEGRIHIFQGGDEDATNTDPPAPLASGALWNTLDELVKYDIVLLSCEGEETNDMNQQALHDYASMGGRVFASHYHYAWFNTGPYGAENLATWNPGGNSIDGDVNGDIITTLPNGMPFPKGVALRDWLNNVGALTNNQLPIEDARHNANVGPEHTVSQAWIVTDPNAQVAGATQYFSFNTPTDASLTPDGVHCGRVVYSDLHVGAASGDDDDVPVPSSCADADLSPQEKALEFMLFDLSSCVTPDDAPPMPPPLE